MDVIYALFIQIKDGMSTTWGCQMSKLKTKSKRNFQKCCYLCERITKGFLLQCWGLFWMPAFLLFGAKWFLKYSDWRQQIGGWIISQFGCARNPWWPSRKEREWCKCHLPKSQIKIKKVQKYARYCNV